MYRPHGYVKVFSLDSDRCEEEDTVRCNHHQAIGFVQPSGLVLWPGLHETCRQIKHVDSVTGAVSWRRHPMPQEQYTCRLCYQPICPRCANLPCRHFEAWLSEVEATAGLRRLTLEQMEEQAHRAGLHL